MHSGSIERGPTALHFPGLQTDPQARVDSAAPPPPASEDRASAEGAVELADGTELSEGARRAASADDPMTAPLPDSYYRAEEEAQNSEGVPDEVLERAREIKRELAAGELNAPEREQLMAELLAIAEAHPPAETESHRREIASEDELLAQMLYPLAGLSSRLEARGFGEHLTFHSVFELASRLYQNEAKSHGHQQGLQTTLDMINELNDALSSHRTRRRRRNSLREVTMQWAERTNFEFYPSLAPPQSRDPFTNARARAEDMREDLRDAAPEAQRPEHETQINSHDPVFNEVEEQVGDAVDSILSRVSRERVADDSVLTHDAVVELLTRLRKTYTRIGGEDFAARTIQRVARDMADMPTTELRRTLVGMAEDADYSFFPGLMDERQYDPFLDYRDAQGEESEETDYVSTRRTEFGIDLSLRRGLIYFQRTGASVELPTWLLRLMLDKMERSPEELPEFMESIAPIVAHHNDQSIRYDAERRSFIPVPQE